jgi:branched-chain amino acid transport system permease protein
VIESLVSVLFNGIAYGVLLFLMAGGLSITMGLMNFANLAHGSLAMLGGYVTVMAMRAGWSFPAALLAAALASAIAGFVLERGLLRYQYRKPELDQVLMTIGIVSMTIAGATFVWGSGQQPVEMPAYLQGQIRVGDMEFNTYRVFLIAVGGVLSAALVLGIEKTNFGAKVRAAVDNRRMTLSCGIDVDRLFAVAFLIGSALAGIGGALSINLLGLDPNFPIKYLVYLLFVVVVGGLASIRGTLLAALLLGICDVGGKYYLPQVGAFILYGVAVVVLLIRPQGLMGRR